MGDFVTRAPSAVDPTVAAIILAAAEIPAHALVADLERLDHHKATARRLLSDFDALLLPTTTEHPDITAVQADRVAINTRLGTYTNFVDLLDMAAVAVPSGEADGSPFGISVITRAFEDQAGIDIAALLTGEQAPTALPDTGVDLAVFDAHLRGRPLNTQLTDLDTRYAGEVTTTAAYRSGERRALSPSALGHFLAALPAPMSLGSVELADGTWVLGFQRGPDSAATGDDISHHGGWRTHLETTASSPERQRSRRVHRTHACLQQPRSSHPRSVSYGAKQTVN